MTSKEKNKLAELAEGILEHTDVLHPPAADMLIGRLRRAEDSEVLDILIDHIHYIQIYAMYRRFDQEASVRDIENLLNIIHSGRG